MLHKWSKMVNNFAESDKIDLITESCYFGKTGPKRQQQPEYAQSIYLRIRSNEEAFAISSYLEHAEEEAKKN